MRIQTQACPAVIVALSLTATALGGPISYLSQERLVRTRLDIGGASPMMEVLLTTPGLFNEGVSDSLTDDFGEFADAFATQTSLLGGSGITMSGRVEGSGSTDAVGTGRSRLETSFALSESSGYIFDASFFDLFIGEPDGFAIVLRLQETGVGTVFEFLTSDFDFSSGNPFATATHSGNLGPGEYTFEALIVASGFKGTQDSTSYDIALRVPSPGGLAALGLGAMASVRRRRGALR